MKKHIILSLLFLCTPAFADSDGTYSVQDLMQRTSSGTPCATAIYESALTQTASGIENAEEIDSTEINTWAQLTFNEPKVIESVLECPEIKKEKVIN